MSSSLVYVEAFALAHGGECIARPLLHASAQDHDAVPHSGSADQRKVFVRGMIPGEKGSVLVTEEHKKFRRGVLSELIDPSPQRISSPCRYFPRCGGCNYQYIPIDQQRMLKRSMVETMLQRQAKAEPIRGVSLVGENLPAYHYRNRISLHISPAAGPKPAQLGFYREGTGEVIDLTECLIASTRINEVIPTLRALLPQFESSFGGIVIEEQDGEVFIAAKLRSDALEHVDHIDSPAIEALTRAFPNSCVLGRERPLYSQYHSVEENPLERQFPVGRFSQVNPVGNDLLQSHVISLITHNEVSDLFAGAGNFAIEIAKSGKLVEAIELDPELIHLGRIAAFKAGLTELQLSFIESSCERYIETKRPRSCVILDPPRSGADIVAKALDPATSPQVIYVSCSLPTLCRDVRTLCDRGYTLVQTWVVDMFAQTHHVETISLFESGPRNSSRRP